MTPLSAAAICLLLVLLAISSYIERLYFEMGKILGREFEENIEAWESLVEPRLGMSRERILLSAAVSSQLALAALALEFGAILFDRPAGSGHASPVEVAQVVLALVLVIIFFNRLLPQLFFARTRGKWIAAWRWPLRILFCLVLPVTLVLGFLLSIVALADTPREGEEESPAEAVEALIEAGREEGILDESDRDLVRSALEFGDKVVRDVMTPRPDMFAVPGEMTIEQFLAEIREKPFSRVPVFRETLDEVTGIVFAHDLLQVSDEEAKTRTVESIERPAVFVPETKNSAELLREMQREKQHMRIVIDEYGGVAGLVTIEDLLEEIVGNISDEHEEDAALHEARREPDGSWIVPGSFELEGLRSLFGSRFLWNEESQANTAAGLVSEALGRIPLPGEVAEVDGLRFEVVASTDRRIEQLRVAPAGGEGAGGQQAGPAGGEAS
jgi:CBS domain containing-hemolysin-like protein